MIAGSWALGIARIVDLEGPSIGGPQSVGDIHMAQYPISFIISTNWKGAGPIDHHGYMAELLMMAITSLT